MRPPFAIDPDACAACFQCVDECPTGAVTRGERAAIDPAVCIGCGHCGVVCTHDAVRAEVGEFPPWTPPPLEPAAVRALLVGRRSVRRYRAERVPPEIIADLLSLGSYSPTASNARDVQAIVVTGDRLQTLARAVNAYYAGLARLLETWYLRPLLWLTAARPYLKHPRKLAQLSQRVAAFSPGHDWLFFDAPAVVVLTTPRRHRRFGRANAIIAAEEMQIYAASQGLGTCWIGYAEVAMRRRRVVRVVAGIEPDREANAVFTLGRPALAFRRLPARAPLPVAWLDT
ncbi:MAG: nitroreductase family protein [Polyangiaceae bacterium]|nr:nitroreductase family protein [Polyangiaceae bacterium]